MATPNVVPRATTEGGIGTSAKSWGKLHIKSSASLGEATVTVTNQDADQILLDINANNTTADVIDIVSTTLTTGSLIKGTVTNSSATLNNVHGFANFNWTKSGNTGDGQSYIITGQSIELVDLGASNHANSTVNQKGLDILVDSFNTNGSNTNTGIEIDVTDATLNYGLDITAENGAGADIILRSSVDDGDIFSIATTTHGATTITTVDDDATAADLTFTIDGAINLNAASGMVFNEDGAAVDFRIESDLETHMFFLDGSTNRISIGDSVDDPGATLEVSNNGSAGAFNVPLLQLNNNDEDQITLDINNAGANTTANIIDVTATGLSTGKVLHADINDSYTTSVTTPGLIHIDFDKSGVTGSGATRIVKGIDIDLTDSATNHASGNVQLLGQTIDLVSSSNQGGIIHSLLNLTSSGADAVNTTGINLNTTDGGTDLKIVSSADIGDFFSIATTTHGATTVTTVDDDAAAAHLTFTIDGDFIITSTDFSINGAGAVTDGTWEGDVIGVEYGGTGAGSYTDNAVLTGTGTSPITAEADLSFTSETLTIGADDNGAATIERKTHGDEAGGDLIVKAGNATGTNKAGGNLVLRAGAGTGTGDTTTGGSVDFVTAIPAGSGTGQQGILYPTAKFQSIANNNQFIIYEAGTAQTDFFRINVEAAGETTITTSDSAGTDADLTFNIDGDMYIDPAGLDIIIGGDDSDIYKIIKKAHSDGGGGGLLLEGGSATAGQTDDPGGHLFLNGGQSTGDAIPGQITFRAANPAGSTGTSLNSLNTIANLGVSPSSTAATKFQMYERGGASTADYLLIEVEEHGATTISTVDTAAAAADLTFTVDGKITMTPADISGTVFHLDANADTDNVVDIDAGILDVDANALDMDLTDSSSITLTSSEAAEDLLIRVAGAHDSSLSLRSDGTGTDAIHINVTAGSLDIDSADNITVDAADNITLTTAGTDADGKISLVSGVAGANTAIHLDGDANAASVVKIDAGVLDIDSLDDINIDAGDNITITAADNTTLKTATADGLLTLFSAHTAGQAIHIHGDADAGSIVDIDAGILDIDVTGACDITAGGIANIGAGSIVLDAAGPITLDSAAGDILFQDAGVAQLSIDMDSTAGTIIFKGLVTDDDILFQHSAGRPIGRFNSGSVLGQDRPSVSGTSSSGILTSNNAFGGFEHRKMVYNITPGNDDNILNVEASGSGSIYVITPLNGLTVHLPVPFGGETYRFVILSKVDKTIAIRTSAIDGNDDIYMRCQTLANDGATTDITGDTLTITNAGAGSYIDITNIKSGSAEIWQAEVFTTDDVAATVADS